MRAYAVINTSKNWSLVSAGEKQMGLSRIIKASQKAARCAQDSLNLIRVNRGALSPHPLSLSQKEREFGGRGRY